MSSKGEQFFTNMTPRLDEEKIVELSRELSQQETDENSPVWDGSYEGFIASHKRGQNNLAQFPGYYKVPPVSV